MRATSGAPLRKLGRTAMAVVVGLTLLLGAGAPSHAVVGGSEASEGEYPFMAALQDEDGFTMCGGTVIARRWVMTAAHCVADPPPGGFYVVTGRTDLSRSAQGQRIEVVAVRTHPRNEDSSHDVALLRLAVATRSPAIALATARHDRYEKPGTTVRVTGWGDQAPTFGLLATDRLREVDLQIVSDRECGDTNIGFNAPTGVCAADTGKDSCQGDSGGPLFVRVSGRRVQLGVVSYGMGCATPKFPGVYAEVNNRQIRSWIRTVAGV